MIFDPSARPEACESPICRCCAARDRALAATLWDDGAQWSSPLTPGVLADNIAVAAAESSVRIDLWREWPRMLAALRRVGPVLSMTRNACAALGTWRVFPELDWSDDALRAVDGEGEFDFDLRHWARAYARHQRSVEGHSFAAEFHDHDGVCFFRACLVGESSLDTFAEWTRVHQSVGKQNVPPPPADLIEREPIGGGEWHAAAPGGLAHLLQECRDRELPVRAIVGGGGAVQGHRFVPEKLSSVEDWTYCHGADVALYFRPESFGEVRLHDLAPGGAECWTVRAYDDAGALALMLLPYGSDRLPMWNFLARSLA
jgi:putative heme degradation protein